MPPIEKLLEIMARLRSPDGGCPWDLEQSFESIAPYTIEEAYEVDDAIRSGDLSALRDELGDLLLQVVFHAQMAREAGVFDFEDVVGAICEKMVRRHPHVFGDAHVPDARAQISAWEESKARERAAKGGDGSRPLGGVPLGLPALLRAGKLQRRAARTGAPVPDAAGASRAIEARLAELGGTPDAAEARAIVGELLFATVALARSLELEPEDCLREANARFEDLFHERGEEI
jgi:MazG family protein